MGFEGLILSDCMRMKAISDHYGTAAGTVAAAKAGVDLIFVCHDLPYQIETAEAFYQAAVNGEIDAAEMDRSIERILAFKEKYAFVQSEPGLAGMQQDFDTVQELANRAVCLVQGPVLKPDEHTFFCGCADYRTSMVGNICAEKPAMVIRLQQEFGGSYMVTGKDPDEEEINRAVEAAADCSQIIVTTLKGHAFCGQLKLVQALAATGKPIMHIAQREPYDLSGEADSIRKLACFDSTDAAENAVVRVLRGAECKGILPIRL